MNIVEIEKQALILILGMSATKQRGQKKVEIMTSLLKRTTPGRHEGYATRFPDVVVVLILRVF